MQHALAFLGRHAPAIMALGIIIGLGLPWASALMAPLLTPAVWLLMFIAALRIDTVEVMGHLRRPWLVAAVMVWMLVALPLVVWAILGAPGIAGHITAGVAAAMVLAAASCPLVSTTAVGFILGMESGLLLVTLTLASLLVPLTLPIVALGLLDLELALTGWEMLMRLGALVLTALGGAALLRPWLGVRRIERSSVELDGINVVILLIFAVAVMDGVAARMAETPGHVAVITALAFAHYGGLMLLTAMVFMMWPGGLDWRRRISIGFSCGCRNLAILIAILPHDADPDTRLYFALGQFPIYMMPMILKLFFRRFPLIGAKP